MAAFSRAKDLLTDTRVWRTHRRRQLETAYLQRSERYRAPEDPCLFQEADLFQAVRQRLSARGWQPGHRRVGEIHTFAVIPDIGWHPTLIRTLKELGRVTAFAFEGERWFWRYGRRRGWWAIREAINQEIFEEIRRAHRDRPIDWIFFYVGGIHLRRDTVRRIREELGIPTVMMCLDDKHTWDGDPKWGGRWTGQVDLAAEFDLYWTSARACCTWVAAEGGRPIYLPEGCDPVAFRPLPVAQDIPVSFVGRAYGFRKDLVRFLRRWHIPVATFGARWSKTSYLSREEDLVDVFNRSRINLGHGGIGYSETLTNVKGRDFDIPCTGGGMYLTTFNGDLAQHFWIGGEIACYHGWEELVDLIHHYLQRPDEGREMARRARERCVREHRWSHRYIRILQLLGVLDAQAVPPPLPVAREAHGA